ncbi:hypothetical protein [Tabrizicola fusiformis]|uniref:hypothetical protein n=1 Tax=Tabrizicola sp. SY72 TaxID=2741673 RepID=UPI001574C7C9|nr:hypothetical protein [Tabrizicola sp. SY72]NTT86257.1 hypothetical protein [Tabrizicola sp. SY72]
MLGRLTYLALAAVVLALWALMVTVTGPAIRKAAGGLAPFDLRITGYDLAEVQTFLGRISAPGRDLYLEAQMRLDTLFPVLLGLFLTWSFVVLYPRLPAIGLAIIAMAGAGADLLENARVAAMLRAPEVTAEMAAAASQATVAKWALDGLALTAFALAVAVSALRRLRGAG